MRRFRDHHVRALSREQIARFALLWWSLAKRQGAYFDICNFVTSVLAKRFTKKGVLKIVFYNSEDDLPDRACVTFAPLTLHIVQKIWDDAKVGLAYARFILAHEIGHIILHDETAVGFSNDKEASLPFIGNDESAEIQANAFADLFLVPDHVALRFQDEDKIETLCVVSTATAIRRLQDARNAKHPLLPKYTGEACGWCSNFTVASEPVLGICWTCGEQNYRS